MIEIVLYLVLLAVAVDRVAQWGVLLGQYALEYGNLESFNPQRFRRVIELFLSVLLTLIIGLENQLIFSDLAMRMMPLGSNGAENHNGLFWRCIVVLTIASGAAGLNAIRGYLNRKLPQPHESAGPCV